MKNKVNVPELRFPEFSDAENWSMSKIKNIVSIVKGEQLNRDLLTSNDKCPVINGGMIPSGYTDKFNYPANTITISEGGNSCGFVDYQRDNFWLGGHCYALLNLKLDLNFTFQLLKFNEPKIMLLRVGSGLPNIQKKTLESFDIIFPVSLKEQQKIADCLSSLDDLITAQTQKMTALQAYKKGLMQRLFPQEGESVPKVRFGEFEGDGEWEKKILSQIATINPSKEKFDDDMLVSFVPMTSVSENGFLKDYKVKTFQEVKKGFTYFRDEDIIFAKITPCFENGKAALLGGLKNGIGFGSTEFHVIRINKNICLPHFLFSYLYSEKLIREGKLSMTGSAGQQRVPVKFFEDYQVNLPSLKEQQKIADCLSSLDKKIAKTNEKLTALLAHKKGLMQKLFPAVDEAN